MKEIGFKVVLKVEDDLPVRYAQDFILEVFEKWGSEGHPGDPFFGMHGKVKVTRITKKSAL